MSKLLAILLFPLCCYAQVGVEPPIMNQRSSAKVTAANFMPGLYEYWEYTSLPTNTAFTSWTGQVQAIHLDNFSLSGNNQVTNSANGTGWHGGLNSCLTNVAFNIGTNWTIAFFEKATAKSGGGGQGDLVQTNKAAGSADGSSGWGWAQAYSGSAMGSSYTAVNGAHPLPNDYVTPIPQTAFYDWSISSSNNPVGKMFVYTNGILDSVQSTGGSDAQNVFCQLVGNDLNGLADRSFVGFIQGIYILTNACSPAIGSNIHYYRTNISQFPQ